MHRRWLCLPLLLAACGDGSVGPSASRHTLTAVGDTVVYATPGSALAEPLAVLVSADGRPLPDISVQWTVVAGPLTLGSSVTSSVANGLAAVTAFAGSPGTARVRASTSRLQRPDAEFTIHVIDAPTLSGIAPLAATPGASIQLEGAFGDGSDAVVRFGGVRGHVDAADATSITVRVPACVEPGAVSVVVSRGAVASTALPFTILAPAVAPAYATLQPGESRRYVSAADLACIRLAPSPDAEYLITLHDTRSVDLAPLWLELRGRATPSVVASRAPFAERWETALRTSERTFGGAEQGSTSAIRSAAVPVVGHTRAFTVLDETGRFRTVSATARHVGQHAALYVDDAAPIQFTSGQLESFAALFDDPIHSAVTDVFGEPSDLDGNERVIVLFTPRVNALTPRGQSSFISGFFYACDLVSRSRCSGSNRGEVLYAMVPDPAGVAGDPRSIDDVVAFVPPVLAHELQHMIHFARRAFTPDELWLSEALAHSAEDIVADVLDTRGAAALAEVFRESNLRRASNYLFGPRFTSVVSEMSPPSSEQRGAAFLFLRHLREHHGGAQLLMRLTSSTRTGVANVIAETGQPWATLVADFGVALWSAAEPAGMTLAPRLTFGAWDLHSALQRVAPGSAFHPTRVQWGDVAGGGEHMAASSSHYITAPPDGATPLSIAVTGRRGASLSDGSGVAVTVSRVR